MVVTMAHARMVAITGAEGTVARAVIAAACLLIAITAAVVAITCAVVAIAGAVLSRLLVDLRAQVVQLPCIDNLAHGHP